MTDNIKLPLVATSDHPEFPVLAWSPLELAEINRLMREAVRLNATVPDGWKLVPVDATDEMVKVGDQKTWVFPSRECWAAMLSAAPAAPQPAQPAQSDAEPLQAFVSPRAKTLMQAFEEGWRSCADSEYIGKEAQNDAFNQSRTVNHCIAEDMLFTQPAQQPLTDEQRKFLRFLGGYGEWDGVWFGDPHPTKTGAYWWRKDMHDVFHGIGVKT